MNDWAGCCSDREYDHDHDLNATLHNVYRSFGDVRPTDELIHLVG